MTTQPIPLTPQEVNILVECPLHYHFAKQPAALSGPATAQAEIDALVRDTVQQLHAAGGPARFSLADCLVRVAGYPAAVQMVERYYRRLERDWRRVMAGNEAMSLKISLAGVSLRLNAIVDRLDRTSDSGILAVLLRTDDALLPTTDDLRQNLAVTIYHALVAATYPLKRPVRIQELWLRADQEVTVELSEDEYRDNLGRLRQPVRALARGEVMARPGLHCDVCPYKYRGCPVYANDPDAAPEDFDPTGSDGKIPPRQWIFKV